MNKQAVIEVRNVGQSFGCESIIRVGRKIVWTSRVFPFGMRQNAYSTAEEEAIRRGLILTSQNVTR